MSHDHYSDVVPWAAFHVSNGEEDVKEEDQQLGGTKLHEYLAPDELQYDCKENGEDFSLTFKGWTTTDTAYAGKRKRLFGFLFRKDDYEVIVVNSSQYSNVGDFDFTVVSDTKESIDEFLKDWELRSDFIEDMAAVNISY